MPSTRSFVRRSVVVGGCCLALAGGLPMTSALAEPTSVTGTLLPTATLLVRGAGVQITIAYTCSADATWGGSDQFITERVRGGRVAQGGGSSFAAVCDGTPKTLPVIVTPSNSIAFDPGTALVQGNIYACDQNGLCTYVPLSGTVRIRR